MTKCYQWNSWKWFVLVEIQLKTNCHRKWYKLLGFVRGLCWRRGADYYFFFFLPFTLSWSTLPPAFFYVLPYCEITVLLLVLLWTVCCAETKLAVIANKKTTRFENFIFSNKNKKRKREVWLYKLKSHLCK